MRSTADHLMLDERFTAGVVLTLLGLTLLARSAPYIEQGKAQMRPWAPEDVTPVAARAWANAYCTPRTDEQWVGARAEAEDFLRSVAMLDANLARDGARAACKWAERTGAVAANSSNREFGHPIAVDSRATETTRFLRLASISAAEPSR